MKLNEKYNPESFVNFIQDFLPEDFNLKEEDIVINKDRYKEITKAKILGFCESLDLHVLEMDHTHDKDPRVAIATNAFKILADHWIHRALVIFKNNDSDNYRFSYLTITLDLNDKNNKIAKKYSNARRYSFYLGTNAKVKTPEQQLIKKGKIKDVDDLLNRFSVEVVNKQFYLEVAKFFDELVSIEDQNLILPGVSETDINTRKSFAVRLIGRAMFCWFLKQKKSDNGQLVPDEILSSKVVSDNYYHNTLEPLFFGVLNTSIDARDIRNEVFDKVPYLNGGLFNPQSDDYYELDRGTFASKYINTLKISDKWFKEFFELLETYNFTIDENTVFDQELSVDPEMLGRIFENLLAEINPETGSSERKRTGSFYTPRQIVEYMVDQSLIEYFKTKTDIEEKKLNAVVSYDLTDDTEYPLNQEEKKQIIDAIESLKILDPACGSGAYPIGALQKIVYILQQVDPDCTMWLDKKLQGVPDLYKQKIINEVKQNPFDYTRKLDVIKNSIFGVDIQPIAVDVSRLRCFLTLVVESEIDDNKPNRGIEPLPNLDFKFVCANTLISLPKSTATNLFDDHSGITELSKIMSEYFSCNSQRKSELKIKFTNAQKEILEKTVSAFGKNTGELTLKLTTWNPFSNQSNSWFDPEWMFGLQEKFDVVIGNPPYINVEGLDIEIKGYLFDHYKTCSGRTDIYIAFIEKALDLIKEKGSFTYIIPFAYTNQKYGQKSRILLIKNSDVKEIVDFSNYYVFESASVKNIILRVVKDFHSHNKTIIKTIKSNLDFINNEHNAYDVDQEVFLTLKDTRFETKNIYSNLYLKDKLNKDSIKFEDICYVAYGARLNHKTNGKGKDFYISDTKDSDDQKPFFEGKNISRYEIKQDGWLNYVPNEHYNSMFTELFENEKIVFINVVSDQLRFALDTNGFYNSHTVINCVKWCLLKDCTFVSVKRNINEDKIQTSHDYDYRFLLGILNSSLVCWYFKNFLSEKLHFYPEDAKQLPIKITKPESQKEIIEIVKKIESYKIANQDTLDLEIKIDELVMDLYGLNEEEKQIVRNS